MEFSDDIGKLDESEGGGELDFHDPNFVKDYLVTFTVLPRIVAKYGLEICEIKEVLKGYGGALEAFENTIWQHLELIKRYQEESVRNRELNEKRALEMEKMTDQYFEATETLVKEVVGYLRRPGLLSRLKNWLARGADSS